MKPTGISPPLPLEVAAGFEAEAEVDVEGEVVVAQAATRATQHKPNSAEAECLALRNIILPFFRL